MTAFGESKGSPSYPEGVIAYGESERTDELPLVAFAFAISDHPEGVRRRSPQRGKEDGEAEANKSTPLPLRLRRRTYPEGVQVHRGEITVGNPVTFGEGERGELPLVIRWRKQRIAFLPLYPFAFTKGDRRRTYPFRGTGA